MVVKKVKQMDTKGTVTEYEFGADAKNVTEDDTHKFVTATEKQEWDAVKAPTFSESSSLTKLTSGEKLATAMGKIAKGISSLIDHLGNKSNPHGVSKSQVGLGNVDNTSDENKPISTATQKAIDALNTELEKKSSTGHKHTAADVTDLSNASVNYANSAGSANAVAWGNVSGKPSSYPPSAHTHTDKVSFMYGSFAGAYEFVANLQGKNKVASGYFQDSAGWTPVGGAWWNLWAVQQNDIESEYDVGVNAIVARGMEAYFGYLGKQDDGIAPHWFPLFRRIAFQSIGSVGGVTGNLWSNGSVVTVEIEGGLTANIKAWSDITLGYVPEGLQPPTTCVFPVSGITTTNGICIQISNDRRVAICNRSNNTINAENWEVFTMCTYALAF